MIAIVRLPRGLLVDPLLVGRGPAVHLRVLEPELDLVLSALRTVRAVKHLGKGMKREE
jgi:hypothetical protein